MRVSVMVVVGLWVVSIAAGAACAQNSWQLIGRDLGEERVELTRLEDGVVSFVDASGRARERALSDLVAAVHELPPPERTPRELPWITRQLQRFTPDRDGSGDGDDPDGLPGFVGRLELVDGQVWVGTLLSADGQSLSWFVEDSVVISVALDRVRSASIHGSIDGARVGWDGIDDRVVLGNGDVLDGFVDEIGERVRMETGGRVVSLPMDRVAGVLLANPPIAAEGMVLRTVGGSVLAVDAIEISLTGRVRAVAARDGGTVEMVFGGEEALSLVVAPDGVGALGLIEPAEVVGPGGMSGGDGLAMVVDEALGFDGFVLRGPVVVRWALPRPARRFAVRATLPPAMWAWGDCEVVVLMGDGTEAARERLWADRPSVEINVPLGGMAGMSIAIESGSSGPVQDRVVFSRPIVGW
ncbi:MAG: hypothetical protein Q9O74_02330 [Planctomycetota bacterium]|nr:hypothetical protein [Planctomycetota bacterium]